MGPADRIDDGRSPKRSARKSGQERSARRTSHPGQPAIQNKEKQCPADTHHFYIMFALASSCEKIYTHLGPERSAITAPQSVGHLVQTILDVWTAPVGWAVYPMVTPERLHRQKRHPRSDPPPVRSGPPEICILELPKTMLCVIRSAAYKCFHCERRAYTTTVVAAATSGTHKSRRSVIKSFIKFSFYS